MSFDLSPLGALALTASLDPPRARARAAGRRSRGPAGSNAPPIPSVAWDQVDAPRAWPDPYAEGRELRFDVHKPDGDVVALLVDDDGGLLHPLLL